MVQALLCSSPFPAAGLVEVAPALSGLVFEGFAAAFWIRLSAVGLNIRS